MAGLREVGGEKIIADRLAAGRPVLGICVGMQMLSPAASSSGADRRLRPWPGAVVRLDAPVIPHMGWNIVDAAPGSALFGGLDDDARFYFVHSYAAQRWEGRWTRW